VDSASEKLTDQQRKRALLRLALGQAQVFGSVMTLVLLIEEGLTRLVMWAAGITTAITMTSIVLFRVVWRKKPR
jgi:hypothetical protein